MDHNVKEYKDDDNDKDEKHNNDKLDVNEDKHHIFVHTFIILKDT